MWFSTALYGCTQYHQYQFWFEEVDVNGVLMGTSKNKNYWKLHCFYSILDTIIVNMEKWISSECMEVVQSVDNILNETLMKVYDSLIIIR